MNIINKILKEKLTISFIPPGNGTPQHCRQVDTKITEVTEHTPKPETTSKLFELKTKTICMCNSNSIGPIGDRDRPISKQFQIISALYNSKELNLKTKKEFINKLIMA
jgi:hypothetical protein